MRSIMHHTIITWALPSLIVAASLSPAAASPQDFNQYFIDAAGKAKPSVVTIMVYDRGDRGGDAGEARCVAYGSGTIISPQGHLVTNYHVINKGSRYQVICNGVTYRLKKFPDGEYAQVDPRTDLALLQIDAPGSPLFTPIEFADSNLLAEGEWVLAIGNPFGLKQSITSGIVSSKGRDNIGFTDIEDFIQTDVPINPGNSGGPLINLYGRLVGINTAIKTESGTYQGISFSIPSNIAGQVCSELMKYGRVRRGWLGFLIKERKTAKQQNPEVVVITIMKNSPAETAGLQKGDVIEEMDGKDVRSVSGLVAIIGKKPVGDVISLSVSRDGIRYHFSVTLREKEEYRHLRAGLDSLFNRYGIEVDEGAKTGEVIISQIAPRSGFNGLKKGDVIISCNNRKISTLDSLIEVFYASKREVRQIVVYRDNKLITIDLPAGENPGPQYYGE